MNDAIKEQISAYIDDELSADESQLLIRQLAGDAALRDQAAAYLAVGRAMRGESGSATTLRQDLLTAIADESALAAPVMQTAPDASPSTPRWLRPVAGGAIAAAVALFAINLLPDAQDQGALPATTASAGEVQRPGDDRIEVPDYIVPEMLKDSGLVGADPQIAAYFLRHSTSRTSLAPGSGRARMLSETAVSEDSPATAREVEDQ